MAVVELVTLTAVDAVVFLDGARTVAVLLDDVTAADVAFTAGTAGAAAAVGEVTGVNNPDEFVEALAAVGGVEAGVNSPADTVALTLEFTAENSCVRPTGPPALTTTPEGRMSACRPRASLTSAAPAAAGAVCNDSVEPACPASSVEMAAALLARLMAIVAPSAG